MTGASTDVVQAGRTGSLPKKTPRHHATADVVFDDQETEFLRAMDSYKRSTGKLFPTWTDALAVLRSLGWNKSQQWDDEPLEVSLSA